MAPAITTAKPTVSRGPGRPPRAVGVLLAERILGAAEELFLKQGYEATTVEEIASHIGATKRTIYVRFDDKPGLFRAVVARVLHARRPQLNTIGSDRTLEERLADIGTAVLRYILDPVVVSVTRVVAAEAYRFPELSQMIEEQAAQGLIPALEQMLREEVDLGRIELLDITLAARLLLSLLTGQPEKNTLRGARPFGHTDRQRWIAGAVSLFLDGARCRSTGHC
jgi:TetR/AcrR family transcriptional regulator, mexJK operon transcriptional repressor